MATRGVVRILCALVALVLSACSTGRERALERVVVVGASMSAGFALDVEVGRLVSMGDVVDRALTAEHAPVVTVADMFFFTQPRTIGEGIAAKALEARPTLLVALDYLFWYGYGTVGDERERFVRVDEGLRLLERFDCPIVVGDLPDMSESIGKMLSAAQVPSPQCRARLNERIRAWARTRGATVVALADTVEKLRTGGAVRGGRRSYEGASAKALLQGDRLHPTLEGLACVVVMTLETFMEGRVAGYGDDPQAIAAALR